MEERVVLYSWRSHDIKVTIEALFENNGCLVIEGYDIGKAVEEYWGDSDYEYSATLVPAEVEKLYKAFNLPDGARKDLLSLLQARYNTNSCYSEILDFFEKSGIKYTGFSWT